MKKQTKLFLKSFVISGAVCAAIVAVLIFKTPYVNEPNLISSSVPQKEFSPTQQDKFTLLVTLKQNTLLTPHAYFLIAFNGEKKSVYVTRLFENTVISNEGEKRLLILDKYKEGMQSTINALNSYFNISISKYIEFTNSSLSEFFSLFDNVVFKSPEAINETDSKRDIYIKIDEGTQIFSGITLVDYISATSFSGGENQTLYESARALSEFLKQNHAALSLKEKEAEEYILKNTDNNLSVVDIEKRRELLEYLLFKSGEGVYVVAAEGEYINLKTAFVLSEQSYREISEKFS